MYDAEMRWERFASAREYANQQSEQYRGDIRNLAALTVKKSTLWAVTCTLCMALDVALYCAGRLGLHGPSPPAWIMGLWLTNNAASFAFMALGTILSLHAGFRANAASVHLLTRKVRVPVPTMRQLDQARTFASEFEQQSLGDIFRVPYLSNSGAPKTDDAVYDPVAEEDGSGKRGRRTSSAPPSRSHCSSWAQTEFKVDRAGTIPTSDLPENAQPEHFRLYTGCQKEFYQHEIYARICVSMGFIHFFQSLCFYGLGHINIELRAFWVAYACTFVLATLLALVLRFEIIPVTAEGSRRQYLPRCEYLGPLAVLPAAIGMSLDFRVQFDPTAIALCWVFVFVAYIMQLIYSLRILEVVLPDDKFPGLGERLGASWMPEGFNKVPSSFYHVLYFVGPPSKLQPGQHDIVREVKEGGKGAYEEVTGSASKQAGPDIDDYGTDDRHTHATTPAFAEADTVQPWKMVALINAVLPVCWVWLIFGTIVDVAIGEQALVTAPHWSRPPMTRLSLAPHELGIPLGFPWGAGAKPFIPEQMAWHEEKRHADEYSLHSVPEGRRLSEGADAKLSKAGFLEAMNALLESIPAAGEGAALKGVRHSVSWPGFFEPQLLACGADGQVAAFTPRGFGAVAPLAAGGAAASAAESFRLSGLTAFPPLVGASWGRLAADKEGLLLVSKAGHLLSCPGRRPAAGAAWSCGPASAHGLPGALPVAEGTHLRAAAAALLDGALHAAMVLESDPGLVLLFAQDSDSWLPIGEMRLPEHGSKKASLAFVGAGDLLITTGNGQVLRRQLKDGTVVASAVHEVRAGEDGVWQAACGLQSGGEVQVVHLSLRKSAQSWAPELVEVPLPPAAGSVFQ